MHSSSKENSFDLVLKYIQDNDIDGYTFPSSIPQCHFPYHRLCVMIDKFGFQVHCHDTGNSVRGYIVLPSSKYEIINATYWKSSGFSHNPDKWEHGKWDEALTSAIKQLESVVEKHKNMKAAKEVLDKAEKERDQEAKKNYVESFF